MKKSVAKVVAQNSYGTTLVVLEVAACVNVSDAKGPSLHPPGDSNALPELMGIVSRLSVHQRARLDDLNLSYIVERHSLEMWSKNMNDS